MRTVPCRKSKRCWRNASTASITHRQAVALQRDGDAPGVGIPRGGEVDEGEPHLAIGDDQFIYAALDFSRLRQITRGKQNAPDPVIPMRRTFDLWFWR